jgi:16S rRNA (guanine527-N7)-methyltransferase
LRRWNRRVSLVGPIDASEVVERHYGESLAALPYLSSVGRELVDLGSGAGFPGLVLAIVRPELRVTLVEARGRKWSFLMSVCRALSLSSKCLNARVGATPVEGLPEKIDWITSRAVRIEDLGLSVLLPRLTERGSLLLWSGKQDPDLPNPLKIVRQSQLLGGSDRRLLEVARDMDTFEVL